MKSFNRIAFSGMLLALAISSLSGMSSDQKKNRVYHWRPDLASVKLVEALRNIFEYDLPLEPYKEYMHKEFDENGAHQTVLSHALRDTKYSFDFVEFLKRKGITDPVPQSVSPSTARRKMTDQ